ncbi:hypothetical protein, partial [Treponema sp. R6D11]
GLVKGKGLSSQLIFGAFSVMGMFMIFLGAYQIAQGMRTDEAEAKAKGIRWAIGGAFVLAVVNVLGGMIIF